MPETEPAIDRGLRGLILNPPELGSGLAPLQDRGAPRLRGLRGDPRAETDEADYYARSVIRVASRDVAVEGLALYSARVSS